MTIGVMCIIVLISIGIGYGQSYEETIASLGSLTKIEVTPSEPMNNSQKSALLNDKAVESFKGIAGVDAVTPVEQVTAYLKSGNYVAMVRLYGIDLTTAGSFGLVPTEGEAPTEGLRLHPELMVSDDLAASFADPNHDWADAVDEEGNPLIDPVSSPIKLTFDYNTLNGTQSADSEGRASRTGTFYSLNIKGVCSSQNYTYSTSAFLDTERLKEWKEAASKSAAAGSVNGGSAGTSASGTSGSSTDHTSNTGNGGNASADRTENSSSGLGTDNDSSGGGNNSSGNGNTARANADTERAAPGSTASSSGSSGKGITDTDTYDLVWIKAEKVDDVQDISELIQSAGFDTYSLNDMVEAVKKQSRQIQAMLGAIGLVSMLVAGICVANTMMMSINERTREIGILKVLGMKFSDISKMFLVEALLVGLAGGIAGIQLSFLMAKAVPRIFADMELRCVIPWWLAVGGILFSGAAAILAAWIPARRAMTISPNEAIRSE